MSEGKSKKTVAIILTRMTSSRLPGKALVDICGKPNLEFMIARVRRAALLDDVCVATTENTTDDPIVELCQRLEVPVYRGDEDDVLGRITKAAQSFGASAVVRLTADCPMIDPTLIDETIHAFQNGSYDYASNGHVRSYPDGMDVEVMTLAALTRATLEAEHPFLREHVTPYIRDSHPQYGSGKFNIKNVVFGADFSSIRWTLDTPEDLLIIRKLCARLPEGFSWLQALAMAITEPELLNFNPHQVKS